MGGGGGGLRTGGEGGWLMWDFCVKIHNLDGE